MSRADLIARLRGAFPRDEVGPHGEAAVYWYADFDTPDGEEPHDVAWDRWCEFSEIVTPLLSPGWEVADSWSDNDSLGCTLRPTANG